MVFSSNLFYNYRNNNIFTLFNSKFYYGERKMRIPFLTRLLEIKEEQIKNEEREILLLSIQADTLERIENILIKSKRRCKNGK